MAARCDVCGSTEEVYWNEAIAAFLCFDHEEEVRESERQIAIERERGDYLNG